MKISKDEFDSLKEQVSAVKKELYLISFMRTDLFCEDFLSGISSLANDLVLKISSLEDKLADIERGMENDTL